MALSSLKQQHHHLHHQHYHPSMAFSVTDILHPSLSNNNNNNSTNNSNSNSDSAEDMIAENNLKKFSYSNALAAYNGYVKSEMSDAAFSGGLSSQHPLHQHHHHHHQNSSNYNLMNSISSCTPSPSIHSPSDAVAYGGSNDQAAVAAAAAAAAYLNSYNSSYSPSGGPGQTSPFYLQGQHHHQQHHQYQLGGQHSHVHEQFYGLTPGQAYQQSGATSPNWFGTQKETSRLFSYVLVFEPIWSFRTTWLCLLKTIFPKI